MNPFAKTYLSEAGVEGDDLLGLYSFLPFHHLKAELAKNNNTVLAGRKGVGKTMLLRLFEPRILTSLFESRIPEHQSIRADLPIPVVATYLNLSGPQARLPLFAGRTGENEAKLRGYGDYLSSLLLLGLLEGLEELLEVEKWREASGALVEGIEAGTEFVGTLSARLAQESPQFSATDSLRQFRRQLMNRRDEWIRYANTPSVSKFPVEELIPFGQPLFHFAATLREVPIFRGSPRVFCLVDQFEVLRSHRSTTDYRPLFNQTMSEAARGGTGVEFKIASRQYGLDNRRLLASDASIEEGRELVIVDLDRIAGEYFKKFAAEMFQKRLMVAGANYSNEKPSSLAKRRLPGMDAREEAAEYVKRSVTEEVRHLRPFLRRWQEMGLPSSRATELIEMGGYSTAHPLTAVQSGIAITRWLRDGAGDPPLKFARPEKLKSDPVEQIAHYSQVLINSIESRYSLGTTKARKESAAMRAVDDFVRDIEEPALFLLAATYKNQQKIYCGFDTIIRLSSNIALVFLEMLSAAYDHLIIDGENPTEGVVQPRLQSQAAYHVASAWHGRIAREYDFGESLQEFLTGLGSAFKRLQLELAIPVPHPNGFSVVYDDLQGDSPPDASVRNDPRMLLREAISLGVIEATPHEDKTHGKAKRLKCYLNRVFCPHFEITEKHHKDPPYVDDLLDFVDSCNRSEFPDSFKTLLARSGRSESARTLFEQRSLFSE